MAQENLRSWFNSGTPWVWMSASAVSISLLMVFGILAMIAMRGLSYFWPADLVMFEYREPGQAVVKVLGEFHDNEDVPAEQLANGGVTLPQGMTHAVRHLVKVGNRDVNGQDFRWVVEPLIGSRSAPEDVIAVERSEWGNFYGWLVSVKQDQEVIASGDKAFAELDRRLQRANTINERIRTIEKGDIGSINYALERLRLKERGLELKGAKTPAAMAELEEQRQQLQGQYEVLQQQLDKLHAQAERDILVVKTINDEEVEVPLAKMIRYYQPNAMSLSDKFGHYFMKIGEFISEEPREANTEGGIFPAIFGTVTLVIVMSIFVTPLGVIAAVYLREYAKQGPITRVTRIAVNNLAGVPSIVYGVFGLGFFVYFLGGNIDQLFFSEGLPSPTFGTPGMLWSSLTLALLTLPVVIVATEEGLSRIPRSVREGSLALGATKAETLWRIVIPMASPALMTGLILAVARAAGEVAPLMLVGVVKLAPSLPVDMTAPFLHLDRKFMHLGFHIHDVGFQSPNVDAARPLVYATALLLVLVIVSLNLAAIAIRNRLREKYRSLEG